MPVPGDPYVLHEESQSDPGDPVVAWHWIIDEEFTFDDETPSYVFSEQGFTPVSLQITTAHGCSDLIAQRLGMQILQPQHSAILLRLAKHLLKYNTSMNRQT